MLGAWVTNCCRTRTSLKGEEKLCLLELRRESPQKTIVGRGAAWGAGMKHPLPQVITSFCTAADALPLDDPAWGPAIPMEGWVQCHGAGCYSKPVTNLLGEPGSASNSFQPTLPCHLQANCGMCDFKGRINVFKVPVKPIAKTLTKKPRNTKGALSNGPFSVSFWLVMWTIIGKGTYIFDA